MEWIAFSGESEAARVLPGHFPEGGELLLKFVFNGGESEYLGTGEGTRRVECDVGRKGMEKYWEKDF